jgi:hypothetical protein
MIAKTTMAVLGLLLTAGSATAGDFQNYFPANPYGMVGTTWRPSAQQYSQGLRGIDPSSPIAPSIAAIDQQVMGVLGNLGSVGISTPQYGFGGVPFTQMYGNGYYGGADTGGYAPGDEDDE